MTRPPPLQGRQLCHFSSVPTTSEWISALRLMTLNSGPALSWMNYPKYLKICIEFAYVSFVVGVFCASGARDEQNSGANTTEDQRHWRASDECKNWTTQRRVVIQLFTWIILISHASWAERQFVTVNEISGRRQIIDGPKAAATDLTLLHLKHIPSALQRPRHVCSFATFNLNSLRKM